MPEHHTSQIPPHLAHDEDTELFSPSLQDYQPLGKASRPQPWRLQSQIWIAFFGGVIPFTLIAYLNAKRLELPKHRLQQIVGLGVIGFITVIGVDYLFGITDDMSVRQATTSMRLTGRAVALLMYVLVHRMQNSADRTYAWVSDDSYSSLWRFGLLVIVVLGTLQNLLVYWIVSLLQNG